MDGGFLLFGGAYEKNSKNLRWGLFFWPSRCLPIEETIRLPGSPHCTLTIEYTFIRYFPCMRETSAEPIGPPRSPFGGSDNTYMEANRIATGDGHDKCKV